MQDVNTMLVQPLDVLCAVQYVSLNALELIVVLLALVNLFMALDILS